MRPLSAPPRRKEPPMTRRDPAPSRIAYRLHRLWLTPFFRTTMRVGLPAFLVAFSLGIYLADADRRASLGSVVTDLREKVKNRPEFLVTLLSIEGASPELSDLLREKLAVPLPQSSLDLDLDAALARIAGLDPVADAKLRVISGGILQVSVREREPALVWRHDDGVTLLDDTGHRVMDIADRSQRADLPLIAGQGADQAVEEAMQIILASGPLLPRLRGLVRMGERRWDIVLDRDQRILLPTDQPLRALDRLIAIDQAQDLLARDIVAVDLRYGARPALRLAPYALVEARRLRGILPAENDL